MANVRTQRRKLLAELRRQDFSYEQVRGSSHVKVYSSDGKLASVIAPGGSGHAEQNTLHHLRSAGFDLTPKAGRRRRQQASIPIGFGGNLLIYLSSHGSCSALRLATQFNVPIGTIKTVMGELVKSGRYPNLSEANFLYSWDVGTDTLFVGEPAPDAEQRFVLPLPTGNVVLSLPPGGVTAAELARIKRWVGWIRPNDA